MKPSTLIALLSVLVLGLFALATVRAFSIFNDQKTTQLAPVKVLVASQNFMKGTLLDPRMVRIRLLSSTEIVRFSSANPKSLLPALESAVSLRIAKENILADEPICEEQLEPFEEPEPVSKRLAPNMYDVTIGVLQEDSAGGQVHVGDWVDVYFMTVVNGSGVKESSRLIRIASNVKVIIKRNNLLPIFAPLCPGKIPFTLETNAYRAALIDFSRDKGDFRLMSLTESQCQRLERERTSVIKAEMNRPAESSPSREPDRSSDGTGESKTPNCRIAFTPIESVDYQREKQIVEAFDRDRTPISSRDLEKLFDLHRVPCPAIASRRLVIQQYSGTRRTNDIVISSDNQIENKPPGQRSNEPSDRDSADDSNAEFTFSTPKRPVLNPPSQR